MESVDTKNPQHIGWFKCTFIICSHFRPPPFVISTFHKKPSLLWIMCCLGLMLMPPSQGGQPQLPELTEPIVPPLSYPALSLQLSTPAGRAGKWLPREPFIMVINALSSIKVHLHTETKQSFSAFFFYINMYTAHKNALTSCVCVMGKFDAGYAAVHKLCAGAFVCFSVYMSIWHYARA